MKKQRKLVLGAHMSIAGGLYKAIERAQSINCTCLQLFTKSNRQWHAKPLTDEDIARFTAAAQRAAIPIVAHASYLINIASPNPETYARSIEALKVELQRAQQLTIPYLVLHPGSRTSSSESEALTRVARGLDDVLANATGTTMILLETMAGQGSSIGHTFHQLATIMHQLKHKKLVGVCLDTCHIFAAGYDVRTKASYQKVWQDFNAIIGLQHLKVIHVNDSQKELNSRVDRHAHIGQGALGLEAFRLLFNDPRFADIPKILETPKEDDLTEDEMNMETIRNLVD